MVDNKFKNIIMALTFLKIFFIVVIITAVIYALVWWSSPMRKINNEPSVVNIEVGKNATLEVTFKRKDPFKWMSRISTSDRYVKYKKLSDNYKFENNGSETIIMTVHGTGYVDLIGLSPGECKLEIFGESRILSKSYGPKKINVKVYPAGAMPKGVVGTSSYAHPANWQD